MKIFAFLASLAQAQLTVDSYSATGATVSWPATDGATYDLQFAINGVVTDEAGVASPKAVDGGSAGTIFDYIDVIVKNGDEVVTIHHLGATATGSAAAAKIKSYDLGNIEGGNNNNGTMMEYFILPDRTGSDCYKEVSVSFGCAVTDVSIVGQTSTMVSEFDGTDNMKIGFAGMFTAPAAKLQFTVDHTLACYTEMTDVDAEMVTVSSGGSDLLVAGSASELVVSEVEGSRVNNYPDTSRQMNAPHDGKAGMGTYVNGEENDPTQFFKNNATLIVFTAEIADDGNNKACTPEVTITFDNSCEMNEVKFFGTKETTLEDGSKSRTTALENSGVSEIAILVIYNGDSVEGDCFIGGSEVPTVSVTYDTLKDTSLPAEGELEELD
jgi:hypothetical protein